MKKAQPMTSGIRILSRGSLVVPVDVMRYRASGR